MREGFPRGGGVKLTAYELGHKPLPGHIDAMSDGDLESMSVRALVEYPGVAVSRPTVHKRLGWGWSLREALTTPSQPTSPPPPRDMSRTCLSDLARQKGLSPDTVRNRVNTLGWDLDRALNTPVISPRKSGAMTRDKWRDDGHFKA